MPGLSAGFDITRSPAASRHLVEVALRHGIIESECLSGSGLSHADLNDPATAVRAQQELTIIRNVIARLGDRPGLGTEAGSLSSLADTGILGYAMMASPTFGDAVALACRYASLTPSFFRLAQPRINDTEAVIGFDMSSAPTDVRRFMAERDLASLMRLLPPLLGSAAVPMTFRLELVDVDLPVEVVKINGVTLAVESSHRNALTFPTALIGRPMPVADPQTAAICIRQCEDLLNRRTVRRGVSAAARIRMIQQSNGMPSMAAIAEELSITERTLHRKLGAEGTSYRALLDEVRSTLAAEMLDSGLTVEETARRLGYSETAAFSRAHSRWTGTPPSRRRR